MNENPSWFRVPIHETKFPIFTTHQLFFTHKNAPSFPLGFGRGKKCMHSIFTINYIVGSCSIPVPYLNWASLYGPSTRPPRVVGIQMRDSAPWWSVSLRTVKPDWGHVKFYGVSQENWFRTLLRPFFIFAHDNSHIRNYEISF